MSLPFSIDPETGGIRIGDVATLGAGDAKTVVQSLVGDLVDGGQDRCNGYAWLHVGPVSFGDRPAHLSLGFRNERLTEAGWNVSLPDAPTEGGWPTRVAIDQEIAFVRKTLSDRMGLLPGRQAWGEIWSTFDAKGFLASNGLRYHRA